MLVVDASAVTELLLGRPQASAAERHVLEHAGDLHAPHLIDVEIVSALRRLVASRDATPQRARDAVTDLSDMPIERYGHEALVPRVWDLRDNFSAYDAVYVALAEGLGVPLLTADGRLARAARKHTQVEVILAA